LDEVVKILPELSADYDERFKFASFLQRVFFKQRKFEDFPFIFTR